jgi:hypothetical protein
MLNSKLGSFREEEIRRGLRTLRGPRHHSAFTSEISGSANLEPHDPSPIAYCLDVPASRSSI